MDTTTTPRPPGTPPDSPPDRAGSRLTRTLHAHPRRALLAVFFFVLVAGAFGGPVAGALDSEGGFAPADSDSALAVERLEEASGRTPSAGIVAIVETDAGTGTPAEVDAAVDAVGFEARGHGEGSGKEAPATVLNSLMEVTAAGGSIGIPGLYVTGDPGGIDEAAKVGALSLSLGTGWAKSLSFTTGQTPVMKYNLGLMKAILNDRVQIAKAVNATVITLDEAPQGYADFDKGAAKKYVIDPHGMVA